MNGLPIVQDVKEVTFRERIKSRVKSRCAPKENARIPSDKDFTRVNKKICAEEPMQRTTFPSSIRSSSCAVRLPHP